MYLLTILISLVFSVDNSNNPMSNMNLVGGINNNMGLSQNQNNVSPYGIQNQYQVISDYINPDEYIVGPGDVFLFNMVTSSRVVNMELIISPTGDILIPIIGTVNVKSKLLSDVYKIIIQKCKEKYEDANIYVNLIKIRTFNILITGDFKLSGMHPVLPTYRVSDIIEYFNTSKNKKHHNIHSSTDSILFNHNIIDQSRNILFTKDVYLIRGDSIINIDLFKYYVDTNFDYNPLLREGDIINIKNSKKVAVLGDTDKQIRISKINDLTYKDLLKQANVDINTLRVVRLINYTMQKESILNEAKRIGGINYSLRSDMEDSYLASRSKTNKGFIHINEPEYLSYFLDLEVSEGDILIVPNQMHYVELIGGVKRPGSYKFNNSYNVSNYLNQTGGYTGNAMKSNIFIIDNATGYRQKIDLMYKPKPGDIIFVQEKPGYKSWQRFTEYVKLAGSIATTSLVMFNIWDKLTEED